MADAIIASLVRSKLAAASDIYASDVSAERRSELRRKHGVNVYASNTRMTETAEIVFLAVKPQDLDAVVKEIAPGLTREHMLISIAAGRTLAQIEAGAPRARVVRVMPNVACMVGEGMSAFALGAHALEGDRYLVRKLLSCFGKVLELKEDLFDAVTALSGSGPAFFAYVLARLADGGQKEGLTRADALVLATQTMLGTARLLLQEQISPEDLIARVASPNGTTVEGLKVLESSTVAQVMEETIRAAARRSRELRGG